MTSLSETTLLAYVDGELDAAATEEITQQLAHDHAAADMVRALRSSSALVRAAFAEPEWQDVPPALVARVEGRRGWRWLTGRRQFTAALGASLAACAAGVAAGIAFERPLPGPDEAVTALLSEVAEYHTSLAGDASELAIAEPSKRAAIETWFAAVLKRPVRIPDLARFGLAFRGGRLLAVDERPVVQFLYAAAGFAGRPLGVCMTAWPGHTVPLRTEKRDGVSLAFWADRGYAYILVGWLSPSALIDMAGALRPQLEET